ncbi:MAG: DUF4160 domain-containing protein [Bacteroidales bacterium]|jgi:hypothetical protein|nr:DUF4160 domain-containing protein [Bacteroidales bacterium]
MPTIYEYLGITILLRTNDHAPIHVHAIHGNTEVKIFLYEKNGVIQTIRYETVHGKFSPTKMNDLKAFISKHKYILLYAYEQIKSGAKVKKITITKRIK